MGQSLILGWDDERTTFAIPNDLSWSYIVNPFVIDRGSVIQIIIEHNLNNEFVLAPKISEIRDAIAKNGNPNYMEFRDISGNTIASHAADIFCLYKIVSKVNGAYVEEVSLEVV